MFIIVLIISVVALGVGAVAFALLNRKSDKEISRQRNIKLLTYIVMVFGIYASIVFVPVAFYIISSLLIIVALRELLGAANGGVIKLVLSLFVAIPVFYFFAQFVKSTPPELQLFTYFIVVHFDGFSQVAGESFGKHKMFPKVSPAKTWEGLAGGILVVILISILIFPYSTIGNSIGEILLLSLIITSAAFLGDVLTSWFKRRCGIKDFSSLIPGHGGVLDRFDSFFMAGAVIQLIQSVYSH